MATQYQIDRQESRVTLLARSSIHDVHVSNTDVLGTMTLQPSDPGDNPALSVTLTMKGFDAGDWLKNRTLHGYLEVKKYPQATFSLSSVTALSADEDSTFRATLNGELQFMGRQIRLSVAAKGLVDETSLHGDAEFELHLPDLGLKAPSFMFVKMEDDVRVQIHIEARASR